MFIVSDAWKAAYPGAAVGILAMGKVANPEQHPALDRRKDELEVQLRTRFRDYDRAALKALPALQVYDAYYKRFKKTYHVQLQLESIVFKGKSIPRVAALVEAMFMAELKNLLLTAGHDLDDLSQPVTLDVAHGHERYIRINGQEQALKAGDMVIADAHSVMSSVIYGPAQRARITARTQAAFFTVYAPPGIGQDAVYQHLQDIRSHIMLFAPDAALESLEVYGTE